MTCSICRLPSGLRSEIEDQAGRQGVPLRTISAYAAERGGAAGKDAIVRHMRNCLRTDTAEPLMPPTSGAASLTALAARDVLAGWYTLSERLARRLHDDGLHAEAAVVSANLARDLGGALQSTGDTEAGRVLEARVLAAALGVVLPHHPAACHALAHELQRLDATELAADVRQVADRATQDDPEAVDGSSPSPGSPSTQGDDE